MRVFLLSIIFLPISTILFSTLGLSCPVTVPTVAYVSKCPSNESEWESAAQQKQCNKLATLQKCTEPEKFVYHCVLNKDGTKYLEVCAQSWFMSGYCARFSVADGRIINDPGLDCTTFSTPCPSRFPSDESFKYQGCYANVQNSTPSKIIKKKKPTARTESNNNVLVGLLWFFVITTLLLPVIIVLIFKKEKLCDWWRTRRKKAEKLNDNTLRTVEDENLLNEDNTMPKGPSYPTVTMEEKTEEPDCEEQNQVPRSISADIEEERKEADQIVVTTDKAAAAKNEDGKMSFRTLSDLQGLCSVENVTVISELREKLSKELSEKKENVWVVQEEKGMIYNDDTTLTELKKDQDQIEVMIGNARRFIPREYRSTESETDVITDKFGASQKCRMSCNHLTEPESLFNYIKEKICEGSAEVKCPKCKALWEMEELLIKSDMSPDEQLFFGKAFVN